MQNNDLLNLLPYLTGGNKDINGLMSALRAMPGGMPGSPPPAPPPSASPPPAPPPRPNAPKYPDYTKLYPGAAQPGSAPQGSPPPQNNGNGMDMGSLMQLLAAMKAQSAPAVREPEIAPTATREIRASLKAILNLNALSVQIPDPPEKK